MDKKNYKQALAPVSYPHTWDIHKFDWVQYEGYASQPLARNINESLGVGSRIDLWDDMGLALPAGERFRSSVLPENLHKIETTLAKLKAPKWPEDMFGKIDYESASRGKARFDVHCRKCHGPHKKPLDPNAAEGEIEHSDLARHVTYWTDETTSEVKCALRSNPDEQLSAQECLNLQNPQRVADQQGLLLFELIFEDPELQKTVIGIKRCEESADFLADQAELGAATVRDAAWEKRMEALEARRKCSLNTGRGVEEWRINSVPLVAIGTDRVAAEQMINNRYDGSRLGLTNAALRDLCLPDALINSDSFNVESLSAVEGLNIMSLAITNRYFEDHPPSSYRQELSMMGYGIQDYPLTNPDELKGYKPRPLHGIWATPPFLHNGSVRTVYQMISPMSEREGEFWVGTKEYDPKKLGYENKEVEGAYLQKANEAGNGNYGHNFDYGCEKYGVIGPYLAEEVRMDIIEYIKVMDYLDDPLRDLEEGLSRPVYDETLADIRTSHPRYLDSFKGRPWATKQAHCSYEDSVYGHEQKSHVMQTYAFEESWDLSEQCGFQSYSVKEPKQITSRPALGE